TPAMARSVKSTLFALAGLAAAPLCAQSNAPSDAKALSLAEIGPVPKPITPPDPRKLDEAIRRGVTYLLKSQNSNGSWGSERSSRPSEVYAPIPGAHQAFRGAVTSLCVSALIETGGASAQVDHALDRAESWMFQHLPAVRR